MAIDGRALYLALGNRLWETRVLVSMSIVEGICMYVCSVAMTMERLHTCHDDDGRTEYVLRR